MEDRAKRILERYGESEKPIQKRIADKDTRRKIYYSHYTDRPWAYHRITIYALIAAHWVKKYVQISLQMFSEDKIIQLIDENVM